MYLRGNLCSRAAYINILTPFCAAYNKVNAVFSKTFWRLSYCTCCVAVAEVLIWTMALDQASESSMAKLININSPWVAKVNFVVGQKILWKDNSLSEVRLLQHFLQLKNSCGLYVVQACFRLFCSISCCGCCIRWVHDFTLH